MKAIIPIEILELANETYRVIRKNIAKKRPIAVFHIADEFSFIVHGTNALPENVWVFDIGTGKTAREFFKHNPPTPAEVENAIQVVEDEVMPLHKLLAADANLYTLDESTLEISQLTVSGKHEQGVILQRADMEQVFGRLAAIISGRPASQDILPTTNSFAATLLILREVMHHLGFMNITILNR